MLSFLCAQEERPEDTRLPGSGALQTIDGCQIYIWDTEPEAADASKEIVFFSHGAIMNCMMYKEQMIAMAKAGYRAISWDHYGQGQSQQATETVSMDFLTEHTKAIMTKYLPEGKKGHFVGLSMGGFVGVRLAYGYPEIVETLTLLDTSCEAEPEEKIPGYHQMAGVMYWMGGTIGGGMLIGAMMPIFTGATTMKNKGDEYDAVKSMILQDAQSSLYWTIMGICERADFQKETAEITVPVLVGVGEEDVVFEPAKEPSKIHKLVAGSEYIEFSGAGHSSSIENPEAVSKALLEFVGKHRAY